MNGIKKYRPSILLLLLLVVVSLQVVAAISAALTMVMGGEKFVVRHVKRIHNAPAWNRAGREEQTYSRF